MERAKFYSLSKLLIEEKIMKAKEIINKFDYTNYFSTWFKIISIMK